MKATILDRVSRSPTVGRFFSRGPISGGLAADDDYWPVDPVNRVDLVRLDDIDGLLFAETCVSEAAKRCAASSAGPADGLAPTSGTLTPCVLA